VAKSPRDADLTLAQAIRRAPGFAAWKHADKIRFFCWYLHAHRGVFVIRTADVARCYAELKLEPPSSLSPFFVRLEGRRPKQVSREDDGFRLERRVLDEFDLAYGANWASRDDEWE